MIPEYKYELKSKNSDATKTYNITGASTCWSVPIPRSSGTPPTLRLSGRSTTPATSAPTPAAATGPTTSCLIAGRSATRIT